MIRRGRAEGWLRRSVDAFPGWAEFHGVRFNSVKIGPMPGFEHRGSTVIATRNLVYGEEEPLVIVPRELILSRANIDVFAKADHQLREVLDVLGDFGRTTRGAVLTFLLMQATICCPDTKHVGVINPLTEYVKFLPDELLPTFWSEEECELLTGTTLRPAARAKQNSLLREFELLRTSTEAIGWCAKYWWDEADGLLTFEDWMRVDAMYRSRALEFPGLGPCMVPCVDFANHASGADTGALYESDTDGNGLLLLRRNRKEGEEITITYGDDKGACENIFSYGFLEDNMTSAKTMFLDLDIPDDDPLRPAKRAVNNTAPGFRLSENGDHVIWESDFVYLVSVNEEDGLDFKLRQTIDGQREVQALWKEHELDDTSGLRTLLEEDPLWNVYQLRAVVLLESRVETQIQTLQGFGNPPRTATVRDGPFYLAERLRSLELGLLQKARAELESQKMTLFNSETVQRYLGLAGGEGEEVDFS